MGWVGRPVGSVTPVSDGLDLLANDLQASEPAVQLSLTRAGVTGVSKAIRVSHEGSQTVMAAEIECTVDLDRAQKGVHMSRFPELFEEAIEAVVDS
jgi:GTP cyclohydrolase IV